MQTFSYNKWVKGKYSYISTFPNFTVMCSELWNVRKNYMAFKIQNTLIHIPEVVNPELQV